MTPAAGYAGSGPHQGNKMMLNLVHELLSRSKLDAGRPELTALAWSHARVFPNPDEADALRQATGHRRRAQYRSTFREASAS
jgi:hypothetical protein